MVQLLILFFFSIKSTHGYEIQRFISLNKMSEWNNIKSGSIYYAINKLERDGCICMVAKSEEGEKKKQIYEITLKGKTMLRELAYNEMCKPLQGTTSDKFLVYPIVANLSKQELIQCIENHIDELNNQKIKIGQWRKEKDKHSYPMEIATLDFMKASIDNQIIWHKIFLENLEDTIQETEIITKLIRETDFMQYCS
ncbi:MAG: PadR family transcriptional regulator [Aminipila sp.]